MRDFIRYLSDAFSGITPFQTYEHVAVQTYLEVKIRIREENLLEYVRWQNFFEEKNDDLLMWINLLKYIQWRAVNMRNIKSVKEKIVTNNDLLIANRKWHVQVEILKRRGKHNNIAMPQLWNEIRHLFYFFSILSFILFFLCNSLLLF